MPGSFMRLQEITDDTIFRFCPILRTGDKKDKKGVKVGKIFSTFFLVLRNAMRVCCEA